jgi:tRNA 2-thiouridine synthesizing protein A
MIQIDRTLEVMSTDAGSVKDFAAWSRTTGNPLLDSTSDAAVYRFVLRKA